MKNHAHDSIGCCCSDKVHREIRNRLFIAEEKTDQLIEFYKRKITDAIQTDRTEDRLTAFNLLPYKRNEVFTATIITKLSSFQLEDETGNRIDFEVLEKEVIDPGLIDRQIVHYGNYDPFYKYTVQLKDTIPAMGYKTYFILEGENSMDHSFKEVNTIETDFYSISVNKNGTLKIFDKQTNELFDQVLLLENGGDDGDEYDYSPLLGEKLIYSHDVEAKSIVRQNKYGGEITISLCLPVPSDLEARKNGETDCSVDVKWHITVAKSKPILHIHAEIENYAKDHRLRVLVPTKIASRVSFADNQFGLIKRGVFDEAMGVWEKEGWSERPDAIYPMLSFVGLANDNRGVFVLTNSTREYEIVGDKFDTIAITLFRSIGVLGKEELIRRPGRPSGIKLPTPDSQMIGKLELDFAITTYAGTFDGVKIARIGKEYTTKIETYNKIPYDAMKLNPSGIHTPANFSLLEEIGETVGVISTLKKAEKEDALVLRLYNPSEQGVNVKMKGAQQASEVNLNETYLHSLDVEQGTFTLFIKPNEVKTVQLK
ncbi:glycoside hydrolase family 38 C-terminal domain-containing protein [Fervidibacillus halotolerans]|uniref:Glycosyl hydrolase-related protein n=1 Tax=Fervidibacillus halotolerans TaxID=2980027 RepID=A0A9E8LYU5_9BACI|nr:glycoside hydrolase family 38 C-terminal domain-containing protein [Fervidibacillus halotolerans]WAA12094.1 glycosyl hydrolase-related protein [Fervidibacillus halotolerans]